MTVDWRPVRFLMQHPDGRQFDLHPLRFQPDGSALQSNFAGKPPFIYPADGFGSGVVLGQAVRCITALLQLRFHQGYEPEEKDRLDVTALCQALGIDLPAAYG